MNENIAIVEDAFDLAFCNHLLDIQAQDKGLVGADDLNHDIRRSKIKFLVGFFQYPKVYSPVSNFMHEVNQAHFQFELTSMEHPQLTQYDSENKGEYKPHKDTNTPTEGQYRKLSMVIQLTSPDNYEGGELIFPEQVNYDPSITKKQGTAIVFPSYMLHGVTPVTAGMRKSLVVWAHGPAFR